MLKQTVRLTIILCAAVALSAGCKSNKHKLGDTGDLLDGDILDGDIALGSRFEDGERITSVQFDAVLFAYDSFQIASRELGKVERVGDYMRSHSRVRLVVEGHCDERGSREYNMALGEHRALAVRAHLVGLGIPGERIQTRSYGEEKPVDGGHNDAAWSRNRRVEFALYR
jgi:peptidoglycan-associated lipoprotein